MWWCSNSVPTLNPTLPGTSFLPLCSFLPPFPPLHPCSSCRAAPGYSLKSSAHPVHPSPPWSPPPGCWAPSRCCAPTSLPFLWSPSRLPLTLKVCALSSSIPKVISMSHTCATWPHCVMWELTCVLLRVGEWKSVSCVRVGWIRWILTWVWVIKIS